MSQRTSCTLLSACLLLMGLLPSALGQNPPPAKRPVVGPPSPQSTHYPILLLAFGNDPQWSLRIGLKGPERFDRSGYPPIPLEPAEVTHETTVDSWTYHAKDSQTGATVAVHLSREACMDALNDTLTATPPPSGKFAFHASVDHAQIGTLKGCARIATELFPKINNRPEEDDDTEKDNPPAPTVTSFKSPTAVAYLNASQQLVLRRGSIARMVATQAPLDFSLSHDGKKLLFTRSDSQSGDTNIILLYDFDSGRSNELLRGAVRQAFWSPDDSRVAFLKSVESQWQVWVFPAGAPDNAVVLYAGSVTALHGWMDAHTALAADQQDALWISDDKPLQTLALKEIYGSGFQVAGSDTIRVHPLNPDLFLVSASYATQLPGHKDQGVLNTGLFLYEVRSKRRVNLTPPDQWPQRGEWSRDGLQILFTGTDLARRNATYRIFWDGTGLQKYSPGTHLVIGQ